MNYKDRNWLAGFVDGEGCIEIWRKLEKRKNKVYEYFVPRVIIANTNKIAIDFISSQFKNHCSKYTQIEKLIGNTRKYRKNLHERCKKLNKRGK